VGRSVLLVAAATLAGERSAGVSAGVHSRTNVYIEPSNRD